MIELKSITKEYPNHTALRDISFKIQTSEMVFLTGHSGAGKSTLLKLLMCIEAPTHGKIFVDDQELSLLSKKEIPYHRRRIGMIYQNPQLIIERNAFDNVALPLEIQGYRHREIKRRVHAALDKVGLLSKEKYFPDSLSSGEQQRIGIARAVVSKPQILLADEPTGNLDPDLSMDILHLFSAFNAIGVTVLIATHDLPLIAQMPYRMITIHNGQQTHRKRAVTQETV